MLGALAGGPLPTDAARTSAILQRYQQDLNANNTTGVPVYNYLVDVPVGVSDVDRWSTILRGTAPPAAAVNSAFVGAGFLNAEAVLAMANDEERREAVHKLAPFPSYDPTATPTLSITKVLRIRREKLSHRQRFPLQQERTSFLDVILNHAVVTLIGGPGSGRTLQAPTILSETDLFKRRRLVLVCANELAVPLTVRRLREERGEEPTSLTVAALLPAEREATCGSTIVVTTADVLLRQLLCDPLLLDVGCVIFDDVHLRSEATDLCLTLLRERIAQHVGYEKQEGFTSAGAVKRLHVLLNCLDDTTAGPLLDFFGKQSACRASAFSLSGAVSSAVPPPTVLYLEETVQWLTMCHTEGSRLCRDPDSDLVNYVENVDAVTSIMAAGDADFNETPTCRAYWCPLIAKAIHHYDVATRDAVTPLTDSVFLSPIVILTPNLLSMKLIEEEVRDALRKMDAQSVDEDAASTSQNERFEWKTLIEGTTTHTAVVDIITPRRTSQKRLVLLTVGDVAESVLPPAMEVGLVLDCARTTIKCLDFHAMADHYVTEFTATHTLRHRRGLAKHMPDSTVATPSLVIHLIPQSVRLSAQHRRYSTDVAHPVFRLPFDRYLQLYQVLQAMEEAAMCRQALHTDGSGSAPATVSTKIAQLLFTNLIGMPAVTSTRYEHVRRVMATVESYAVASSHVELSTGESMVRLKPLGVLTTCLPLPTSVTRLLTLSSIFQCCVEGTALAAMWLVGDIFEASSGMLGAEHSEEQRDMFKEARIFFARESASDVVSAFHVYRMWLSMRQEGPEAETAFLEECPVSQSLLQEIARVQSNLCCLLKYYRLFDSDDRLLERVVGLSDEAVMDGKLQACLTAALYPNCTVPNVDGTCVLMDAVHAVTSSRGVTAITRRVGLFTESSVLADANTLSAVQGRPFVFHKKATAAASGNARVAVLEAALPLMAEAAVVFCGEGHERPKQPPHRCRGWSSVLTDAWRHTKRARQLPPPPQLPPVSVSLQLYDTIHSRPVILHTDHNFHFTMRQSTSQWLLQLRECVQRHLEAMAGNKHWTGTKASAKELANAWEWWLRRRQDCHGWLREEREALACSTARVNGVTELPQGYKSLLTAYYEVLTRPGQPSKLAVSAESASAAISNGGPAAAGPSAEGAEEPSAHLQTYRGSLPNADVEQTIQMCVKSVASRHSRDSEAQLLRDNPGIFSFLDPENQFHEYYLYLLRQAAPDLEMLGDNLEELIEYLTKLEEDLREELGLDQANTLPTVAPPEPQPQFDELGAEADTYAQGGLQVETAAVNLKRPTGPFFAAPPTISLPSVADAPSGGTDPTALVPEVVTPPPPTLSATVPLAGMGDGPLLERLLAMMNGHSAAPHLAMNSAPLTVPNPATSVVAMGINSLVTPPPPPTADDLLSVIQGVAPDATMLPMPPMPAPPVSRATTEELMALLAPPPPAAETFLNPLQRPPPPLPARLLEESPPSVVVYPLPDMRYGNIPLCLAKALGETLGMKVGPTIIVGRVARIDVPNHKVEARAIAIKTFSCLGKKLNIFKNDRILDNPDRMRSTGRPLRNFKALHRGGHMWAGGEVDPTQGPQLGVYIDSDEDDDSDISGVSSEPEEKAGLAAH